MKEDRCNAWDKNKNESIKAYTAFVEYIKMDPEERSLTEVSRHLNKSRQLISKWSIKNHWRERTDAYDEHILKKDLRKNETEYKKMRNRQIETARKLQDIALKKLEGMSDEEIEALKGVDALSYFIKGAEMEARLRLETIKNHPQYRGEENETTLADIISAAFRDRSLRQQTDTDEE